MVTNTPEEFMLEAIAEAKKAKSSGDLPFGAVVVHYGKIIGRGRDETHTKGDVTDHAEMIALREACRKLKSNNLEECIIYCTNEPCLMCAAAIFQANIPKVVIGLSRSDLPDLLRNREINIYHLAKDSNHPIEIVKDVLKDKILPLFRDLEKK